MSAPNGDLRTLITCSSQHDDDIKRLLPRLHLSLLKAGEICHRSSIIHFINMGNYYCKVCNVELKVKGDMCSRCYEKMELPICSFCGNKINAGEEILCGVHKFPCYGEKNGRCCRCNRTLAGNSTSSFCESCCDSLHPPPRKLQ
ncbi:uncharacterized protein [Acropora muricata]|uniref:uncharacterized protein n=1 Tax=Acropora muricata TaxID=159855 RepID=UPI0034E58EED